MEQKNVEFKDVLTASQCKNFESAMGEKEPEKMKD